jgi:hypothetical protein
MREGAKAFWRGRQLWGRVECLQKTEPGHWLQIGLQLLQMPKAIRVHWGKFGGGEGLCHHPSNIFNLGIWPKKGVEAFGLYLAIFWPLWFLAIYDLNPPFVFRFAMLCSNNIRHIRRLKRKFWTKQGPT